MRSTQIKHLFLTVASIIILCAVSSSVLALPIESSVDPNEQPGFMSMLDQIQKEGLKRALSINAELTTKVSTIIEANKRQRASLEKIYKEQMIELKKVIDKASSEEIAVHVTRLEQTSKKLQQLYIQKWEALKLLLTDKQQARYLLYQDALQRELQRRAIKGLDRSAADQ